MTSNLCPSPKEGHKEFLEMNLCYANQNETVMAGNRTNLSNVLTAHCDEACLPTGRQSPVKMSLLIQEPPFSKGDCPIPL